MLRALSGRVEKCGDPVQISKPRLAGISAEICDCEGDTAALQMVGFVSFQYENQGNNQNLFISPTTTTYLSRMMHVGIYLFVNK